MFLHDAVLEAIICGETEIPSDKYQTKLQKLKKIDSSTVYSGLQSQFDILSQVTPDPDKVCCDTAKAHSDKNRTNKYLPCESLWCIKHFNAFFLIAEKFLVSLQEYNGYINASFVSVCYHSH